jgi:hypothetical protein
MTTTTRPDMLGRFDELRRISAKVGAFLPNRSERAFPRRILDLAGIGSLILGGESCWE